MKTRWTMLAVMVMAGAMALPAFGQQQEKPEGAPPPEEREDRQGPPPGAGEQRGPRGQQPRDGDRPPLPARPPMPPMPPVAPQPPAQPADGMPPEVRRMMGYISLVEQYSRLARDANTAGVAAVVTAADILRPRGADAAIEYLEKQLPQATSAPVRNAIRLQLAEFYRHSGQQDKALEQLSELIKGSGGEGKPAGE